MPDSLRLPADAIVIGLGVVWAVLAAALTDRAVWQPRPGPGP